MLKTTGVTPVALGTPGHKLFHTKKVNARHSNLLGSGKHCRMCLNIPKRGSCNDRNK